MWGFFGYMDFGYYLSRTKLSIMDYGKLTDICIEDVDHDDYPDYCDAYVASAKYEDVELTEEQLDELNDSDFVIEYLLNLVR